LLLAPAAPAETPASRRAAAHAQFLRAEKQRTALQGKSQKERTLQEYAQLVAAYRRVYLITPHAAEVPPALLAVAELYHEMGRNFDEKYYQSAIDTYRFLLRDYPITRFRDDALLTIGEIQKDDLQQPDEAEKTFQEFLRLHPRSEKADDAREALAEIAGIQEQKRKRASRKELAEQQEKDRKLPQVTRIRSWNAENYTRVVIDVEDQVKYQAGRISNPDRVYFDLHKSKLSSTLAGKTFDIEGGLLKKIRVAQNQAGVVRVVLDVEQMKDYSVFLLPNPYRLVVDVYGAPPVTSKPAGPREPEKVAAATITPEKKPAVLADTEVARSEPVKPVSVANPARVKATKSVRETAAAMVPPPVPQPTHDGQRSLTRALGLKIGRIVIDAGHGGSDTGTIGPTGLMEKDLCLDIARRLGKIIQQRLPGAEVVFTREDDTFIPLENRTAVANQAKADLFISIHANSSRDHKARGVETYYLNFAASEGAMEVASRENALSRSSIHELQDLIKKIARNDKIEESRELATDIQDALSKRLQRQSRTLKNRGVRKAPFVVLIGANMPSVLSEISFLSNPADEQMLKKPEHRQRVAEGLYHGVESYLQSINSLTYNQPKASVASH
jgi:N-acetylmuramoyl-L-alanine amidase